MPDSINMDIYFMKRDGSGITNTADVTTAAKNIELTNGRRAFTLASYISNRDVNGHKGPHLMITIYKWEETDQRIESVIKAASEFGYDLLVNNP